MRIDLQNAKVELEFTESEALEIISKLTARIAQAHIIRGRGQRRVVAISRGVPVGVLEKDKTKTYQGLFNIIIDHGEK